MTNYKNTETEATNGNGNISNTRSVSSTTSTNVNQVFELFNQVFEKYSPEEVFVSFNGGKDCTVVLDLLCQYYKSRKDLHQGSIPVLYIRPKSPFREVEDFVSKCAQTYKLDMIVREGNIKPTLETICADRPNLKAVVMGVRRSDPSGRTLKNIQPTDPGWPPLVRVNPILDWSWQDVWQYILENNVGYCSLYDMGYTSLGDTTNTVPNLHLRRQCPLTGKITYLPAYKLTDESLEREGR